MKKIFLLIVFLYVVFLINVNAHIAFKNRIEMGESDKIRKTDEYAVEVDEGEDVDRIAMEHGYRNMGRIGNLKGYFLFKKLKTKENYPKLRNNEKIKFVERQVLRRRYKRIIPSDPLWGNQWHLQNTGSISLKPMEVWDQGIVGRNVTIAIVDDGLEKRNFDLAENFNQDGSWDFNYNDDDPTPISSDAHGTSAAGCAAAPFNTYCGAGVAPSAKLSGIRLIALDTSDQLEARGLSFRTDINDIFTNSWGPFDDGRRYEGAGRLLRAAMEQSILEGRGGKGTIYVWAGGNGRRANDNCNYDGYANKRYTIAIGAIGNNGVVSYYSEPCSALFAVAPSSGGSSGITTTALNAGTSAGCSTRFGGTSAAAPLAAGVYALMLQANNNLTWRDVQHITALSSTLVDQTSKDWWTNQGGFKHNHDYGFGLLNPVNAVNLAKNWVNVPPYLSYVVSVSGPLSITNVPLVITFDNSTFDTNIDFIEHVDVTLKLTHPQKGKLLITLKNDFGTTSYLSLVHGDTTSFPGYGWTYGSVRHWGEIVNQKWYITITNSGTQGTFLQASLTFYGHKKL